MSTMRAWVTDMLRDANLLWSMFSSLTKDTSGMLRDQLVLLATSSCVCKAWQDAVTDEQFRNVATYTLLLSEYNSQRNTALHRRCQLRVAGDLRASGSSITWRELLAASASIHKLRCYSHQVWTPYKDMFRPHVGKGYASNVSIEEYTWLVRLSFVGADGSPHPVLIHEGGVKWQDTPIYIRAFSGPELDQMHARHHVQIPLWQTREECPLALRPYLAGEVEGTLQLEIYVARRSSAVLMFRASAVLMFRDSLSEECCFGHCPGGDRLGGDLVNLAAESHFSVTPCLAESPPQAEGDDHEQDEITGTLALGFQCVNDPDLMGGDYGGAEEERELTRAEVVQTLEYLLGFLSADQARAHSPASP